LIILFQITQAAEDKADSSGDHFLATLAEETKKLMKKDSTLYLPILAQWHPQAAIASASLLHKLYGQKLVLAISPIVPCLIYIMELIYRNIQLLLFWPSKLVYWRIGLKSQIY
jgi:hypothetical protein